MVAPSGSARLLMDYPKEARHDDGSERIVKGFARQLWLAKREPNLATVLVAASKV